MARQNLFLLLGVAVLAVIALILNGGADFAGTDVKILGELERTDYKPWFAAIWEPPSAEVESFLFALQAGIGAGFIGYFFGYMQGRKKAIREREQASKEDKCYT